MGLVQHRAGERFPGGGGVGVGVQTPARSNQRIGIIQHPLLEEMLLTFGTNLIAFFSPFSDGINSPPEYFRCIHQVRGRKICILNIYHLLWVGTGRSDSRSLLIRLKQMKLWFRVERTHLISVILVLSAKLIMASMTVISELCCSFSSICNDNSTLLRGLTGGKLLKAFFFWCSVAVADFAALKLV